MARPRITRDIYRGASRNVSLHKPVSTATTTKTTSTLTGCATSTKTRQLECSDDFPEREPDTSYLPSPQRLTLCNWADGKSHNFSVSAKVPYRCHSFETNFKMRLGPIELPRWPCIFLARCVVVGEVAHRAANKTRNHFLQTANPMRLHERRRGYQCVVTWFRDGGERLCDIRDLSCSYGDYLDEKLFRNFYTLRKVLWSNTDYL